MAGKFGLTFEVKNLARVRKKLQGAPIFAHPIANALDQAGQEIEVAAHRRAPIGPTLALSSSIKRTLDPSPVPTFVKVTANASSNGFRYPWALQSSKKRQYHYRFGVYTGRLTYRWFTGSLRGIRKKLDALISDAARRTEDEWRL